MTDDLISRREALEAIAGIAPDIIGEIDECEFYGYSYYNLETTLLSMPTVDAEPVRRGKWLPPVIGKWGCLCSNCNKQADNDFAYCPNCGAKMEVQDETN